MNRPIVIAVISYIFGILFRLYTNCIAFIFMHIILFVFLFLIININNKYFRFIKIHLKIRTIIIILIFLNLGYLYTNVMEEKYEYKYATLAEIEGYATILEEPEKKEYNQKVKAELLKEKIYVYIYIDKNIDINYGDLIYLKGEYLSPDVARNEKGFNYRNYLKTLKIFGSVKTKKVKVIEKNKLNSFFYKLKCYLKSNIKKVIKNEEYSNIVIGMVLGDISELSEDIKKQFNDSNLTHILAVSGTQVSTIILGITVIIASLKIHKRKIDCIAILVLIIFLSITNASPSVQRACIVSILNLIAKIFFRRADIWNNLAISLFVTLINNPYNVYSLSLILSYLGFLGIIAYSRINIVKLKFKSKFIKYIVENVCLITTIQIFVFPVILYNFGTISLTFLFSNIIVIPLASIITFIGFIIMIFPIKIFMIVNVLVQIVVELTSFFSNLKISKIYVPIPYLIEIIIYYVLLIYIIYLIKNDYIHKIKHFFRKNKKRIFFSFLLILLIFFINLKLPKTLRINFIDVGQGDSTLITTEYNKNILIDGGGNELNSSFDVGERTLLPYLLKQKIFKLDYIIISHFDSDHIEGLFIILEELVVDNVVIGKQFEASENYEKLIEIVKNKRIKLHIVEVGDKIHIDKSTYIDVLWPDTKNIIKENILNNNSLVCKLIYKDFSMLFTGDIEEIAEEKILSLYKNKLKSTILKIAHHGSKTSSMQEFIDAVSPEISLIGVGKNNNFGHPNEEMIQRLKNKNIKVYRTDKNGEIKIEFNKDGTIGIKSIIN